MNRKLFIWIMAIILLIPIAIASDGGLVGENVTLRASLTAQNILFDTNITANITIVNAENNTVTNNQLMNSTDVGIWEFIFVPNSTGNFLQKVNYYNSSGLIAQATESFEIRKGTNQMLTDITIILIIMLIGFGLGWFSERTDNFVWYTFGSIWFFAAAPILTSTLTSISSLFSFLGIGFYWLIALIMAYNTVEMALNDKMVDTDE